MLSNFKAIKGNRFAKPIYSQMNLEDGTISMQMTRLEHQVYDTWLGIRLWTDYCCANSGMHSLTIAK
jgi:hypothetical protein